MIAHPKVRLIQHAGDLDGVADDIGRSALAF
jgi:hypothetical protein